eukprot:TRINITY_DN12647_c0_g1_i1.p1 TRINITY_DN12647_c0_g1~~TRINITY_DN12647_c0_g1_i1.p1  ORF type:complete len:107 (+),score=15.66 TRINITY_DN12647_c0_g1_i1:32-352(+)
MQVQAPPGVYAPQAQPQIVYVQAPPQSPPPQQAPIIINNNNNVSSSASAGGGTTKVVVQGQVNHCDHFKCCIFSCGLWLPCWMGACCGCCCYEPPCKPSFCNMCCE